MLRLVIDLHSVLILFHREGPRYDSPFCPLRVFYMVDEALD